MWLIVYDVVVLNVSIMHSFIQISRILRKTLASGKQIIFCKFHCLFLMFYIILILHRLMVVFCWKPEKIFMLTLNFLGKIFAI